MDYSDFTLTSAVLKLALNLQDHDDLFDAIAPIDEGELLTQILTDSIPLATAIHTEKARSELIVVPILVEAWEADRAADQPVFGDPLRCRSIQGPERDLRLFAFQISEPVHLGPPVLAVVEAKNDSIQGGLGQCVAEMVAAQIFNARQIDILPETLPDVIFGVVTTGSLWRFLRLEGANLVIDRTEYSLASVGRILAIIVQCLARPIATTRLPHQADA